MTSEDDNRIYLYFPLNENTKIKEEMQKLMAIQFDPFIEFNMFIFLQL